MTKVQLRWAVTADEIVERDADWDVSFVVTEIESGKKLNIKMTSAKKTDVAHMVGALRATAQRLLIAAGSDELIDGTSVERSH